MDLQKSRYRKFGVVFACVIAMLAIILFPVSAQADELGDLEEGNVRIHVLPFDYTEAIVVECDGHFGLVDCAEDSLYPDGTDRRYPARAGISGSELGREKEVIWYLKKIGVTNDNLDFFIGTHPHSDHIGSALQVIQEFHPKTIYTPVYKDSYITNSSALWDNLFVYDRLVIAANWAKKNYGAEFIQHLNPSYTSEEDAKEGKGSPFFKLGNAQIEIVNYSEDYQSTKVPDANYFSYGVKVTAPNGCTAFLSGDINNYTDGDASGVGDESRLANTLGKIDFLKLGHHGSSGSNSISYLQAILKKADDGNGSVVVQTGEFYLLPWEKVELFSKSGIRYYRAAAAKDLGHPAFVVDLTSGGVRTNCDDDQKIVVHPRNEFPYSCAYKGGLPYETSGWVTAADGKKYYFGDLETNGKTPYTPLTDQWIALGDHLVYLDKQGCMATGWQQIDDEWYFFSDSGEMKIGWVSVEGDWYYLGDDGVLATGWLSDSGSRYYLNGSGKMATGWQQIDDEWYFFSDSGAMTTGWAQSKDVWYYLESTGVMATGWLFDGGVWYYLNDSGSMATGWVHDGNDWYFMNSSGAMMKGWVQVMGTWYFLQPNGVMATGWLLDRGTWYYLLQNGAMATGWVNDGGNWYFMNKSGEMLIGGYTIDGHDYYFSSSGAMI